MGYPVLSMILELSTARYYCDSSLLLDTMTSSLKSTTTASQSTHYGSVTNELKSVPASKSQLIGIGNGDLRATDANRTAAGY